MPVYDSSGGARLIFTNMMSPTRLSRNLRGNCALVALSHALRIRRQRWSTSALPPETDIRWHIGHVYFVPQTDIDVSPMLDRKHW
jgi:hypothetical protein